MQFESEYSGKSQYSPARHFIRQTVFSALFHATLCILTVAILFVWSDILIRHVGSLQSRRGDAGDLPLIAREQDADRERLGGAPPEFAAQGPKAYVLTEAGRKLRNVDF